MPKNRGLEKLFGTYQSPQKRWKTNNREHISAYNANYYQRRRDEILQRANLRYQLEKERRARRIL